MRTSQQEGFTVLESLVAFTILVATLITAFQLFGEGLPRLASAKGTRNDLQIALSLVSELRTARSIRPGTVNRAGFRVQTYELDKETFGGLKALRVSIWPDDAIQTEPILSTIVLAPED